MISKSLKKALSLILTIAMVTAIAIPVQAYASTPTYVSEVVIATGSSVDDAVNSLTNAGYKTNKKNLNQGNKTVEVMGYKTTTDKSQAITDLAVMNMDGDFSYSDYQDALEDQKNTVDSNFKALKTSIEAFKENYDNGDENATFAYNQLNKYVEDDSNKKMGDILVADTLDEATVKKVMLQGNEEIIQAIIGYIHTGCTTNNWVESVDEGETAKSNISDAKLYESTQEIVEMLDNFQENVEEYEQTSISNASEDEFSEDLKDADTTDQELAIQYYSTVNLLKETNATNDDYDSLYDELVNTSSDDIDQNDLLPIVKNMTEAERATLPYITLNDVISDSVTSDDTYDDYSDDISETMDKVDDVSVYSGVDRTLFTDGDIALTQAASDEQGKTGNVAVGKKRIPTKVRNAMRYVGVAGIVMAAVGTTIAIVTSESVSNSIASSLMSTVVPTTPVKSGQPILLDFNSYQSNAEISARFMHKFQPVGYALIAIAIVIAIVVAVIEILSFLDEKEKEVDYTDIPRVMVQAITNDDDTVSYTNYYATKDLNGKYADLNGFKGQQWLALYYTKDTKAGNPITTDMLVSYAGSDVPSNYSAVHYFGRTVAYNLNNYSVLAGKTAPASINLYFLRDTSKTTTDDSESDDTGSIFSNGGMCAISGVAGLVIGGALVAIITRRKKTKKA